MEFGSVHIVHLRIFIGTTVYERLRIFICGFIILMGIYFFSTQCLAEEAAETQESIQEESHDIPGSTFYVPRSMFQTTEAYEDYCTHMYELGYMNGQFEWTDAAQAFINNPQNIEIAEELEEDRQRILSERELEFEKEFVSAQETTESQSETISKNVGAPNSEIRMTEVLETEEESKTITEEKNSSISFGAILLVLFVIFLNGAFYYKKQKK